MRFSPYSSPLGPRRLLLRGLAALLLLMVCADVVLPQPCCTGVEGPTAEGRAADSPAAGAAASDLPAAAVTGGRQPGGDQHHESTSCGDDCLCCGHVTTGTCFSIHPAPDQKLPAVVLRDDSHASPPLPNAFHPPRLA